MTNKLAIIVPVYNEEEALEISSGKLLDIIKKLIAKNKISSESYIVFVNDGSKDKSLNIIKDLAKKHKEIKGIALSKNFGHQGALLCGLLESEADVYISIDADLQDDTAKIEEMIDLYSAGNHIVFGVRKKRTTDTFFKKHTAVLYYNLLKFLGVDIIPNHADYRLMSNLAVDKLKLFKERNLFLRGIITRIGLKSSTVYYDRLAREQGETKYTLHKMLALAFNGIFAFSTIPLRFIAFFAAVFIIFSLVIFIYILFSYLENNIIKGWTSLIASIYFVGGLILLSLAIIAEYIARIYTETKARPLYIIEEKFE
ncbi:MAG: glycosyltransferase family 2 protein [Alphaproteobacteria bacterium]|nr:glycosyltransferase family 2 protein [Alphaproteobacteria bacterium]